MADSPAGRTAHFAWAEIKSVEVSAAHKGRYTAEHAEGAHHLFAVAEKQFKHGSPVPELGREHVEPVFFLTDGKREELGSAVNGY